MLLFHFSHREIFIFQQVTIELHTHGFMCYLYPMKFVYQHAFIIKLSSVSLFYIAPKILYSSVALGLGDFFPYLLFSETGKYFLLGLIRNYC